MLVPLLALPLSAQRVVPTLDAGGAQVRYADSIQSSAATISPAVRIDWDRATFSASGTFASFAGGWSGQGALSTSLYTPIVHRVTGEISGATGGSAHEDGSRTGQSSVIARAHLMEGGRGLWGGAGIGSTWDGFTWRGVRVAEIAGWTQLGPGTVLGIITPTRVADTIRYTDAELDARWELAGAEIAVSAGHRTGDRLPTPGGSARSWGSVSATAWVARYVAVVGSAGSYPVDFTQGFPGGRFVSLGVRFGLRARHRSGLDASSPNAALLGGGSAPVDGVLALRVLAAGAQRTIRVQAPGATTVEITGDFTNWQPARLTSAGGGWWAITLPLAPGTYEMTLRVNGGRWIVPPGIMAVRDEFGASAGLLMVP